MTECHHCGVVYSVQAHEDFDDAEEQYCPFCGEEPVEELDFEE